MSTDLTHARSPFWPAMTIIFLGSFVGMYHVVSLNVSLPGFMAIFDSDLQRVQWIITGFALACGMVAPISGYAIDRFGSKRLFLFSLIGISISSMLCASAWNIQSLIAFRVLQGLFCGFIQPISLAMIYQTVEKERQVLAVSIWSFSTVFSTSIGPTLSGWLQGYNWHLIFLVTVPVGLFTFVVAAIILPDTRHNKKTNLDWRGLLLATFASLSLLLFFGNMNVWGWQSMWTWGTILLGTVSTLMFISHELRTPHPLLHLKLFKNVTFTLSLSASLILTFGIYSGVYFIPLFLGEIQGMTSYQIGLKFLPAAVCLTCATFLSGRLYKRLGPAKLLTIGSIILFISTYYFSYLRLETTMLAVMVWLSIRNTGTGLTMTPITNASMSSIPEEYLGHASALISWLRQVFSAMALGLCTSLFYARMGVHEKRLSVWDEGVTDRLAYQKAYILSISDAFRIASLIIVIVIPLSLLLGKRLARSSNRSVQSNESLSNTHNVGK
ncbi:DHA2 family efflux MFS transporter permease subunit [Paenibacillus endoradicis]|uniref:DHA2 family efflux MFS transporter permease subunit n=1 Tax=Paenibacillus endoradicis TaxID=2972487 RepID=UPI002158B774|nr:DHA2 family efflux MFS transporter permease subunit [Paenibacillus endoradicis]MCR8656211.1 DHA2 family efflux MFS transporter permease subunit [Paenibacillus endoradicis]